MKELIKEIKRARFIWICGNGGSAATAEHLATDLVKRGFPAICLNSQNSVITMIANDFGYREIFCEQITVYANKKDLLITISCSGRSKNIEAAIRTAYLKELKVYQFATFDSSGEDDYGLLEDKHLKFVHEIVKAL